MSLSSQISPWPRGPVLAIETSCDETAAAILSPSGAILAQTVLSQRDHLPYGGVVPEIAARAHLKYLPGLVQDVLRESGLGLGDLGAIAATVGPGLIGGLIVGSSFAKGLAIASPSAPFLAINHLEAHALTARLPHLGGAEVQFPYLVLLLSGGHCQCVAVDGIGQYRRLGATIDDAVGEAFDKTAKMLGLGWPGGPLIEKLALAGNPTGFPLPRPLIGRAGCDFSFSGLKTAVAQTITRLGPTISAQNRADIAASFQEAVCAVLADRATNALEMMPKATRLVVGGGVAANTQIRAALTRAAKNLPFSAPPASLCGDNAVMIAWAAIERLRINYPTEDLAAAPRPRYPLDQLS